ncbi:MAG: hypothetical protein II955_01175 [Clostridia bacterium]|nr:hypothetical protein [Clostridia bacterium]
MRKRDIVKLVFASILIIAALICCVMSVTVRQGINEAGEQVDNAGEAIGFTFAALFMALFAVIGVGITVICDLVSSIICIFGIRSPDKPAKIVFSILLVSNIAIALVAVIATFAGG